MATNKTFAYVRVSTKEQNIERQIEAIKEYCISSNIKLDERDILIDKYSGVDFDRPQYQVLRHLLRSGDTLIVKELDRLGRTKDLIKQELNYFKKNNIRVKILNIPTTLIDLPTESKWVFDMINNILIEVLGAIAEEERIKTKQRQMEGIKIAKAQGKHLGRPKVEYPNNWVEVYTDWKAGKIMTIGAWKLLNLKKSTFYNLVKKYEQ